MLYPIRNQPLNRGQSCIARSLHFQLSAVIFMLQSPSSLLQPLLFVRVRLMSVNSLSRVASLQLRSLPRFRYWNFTVLDIRNYNSSAAPFEPFNIASYNIRTRRRRRLLTTHHPRLDPPISSRIAWPESRKSTQLRTTLTPIPVEQEPRYWSALVLPLPSLPCYPNPKMVFADLLTSRRTKR
jgi:hypothetical protein